MTRAAPRRHNLSLHEFSTEDNSILLQSEMASPPVTSAASARNDLRLFARFWWPLIVLVLLLATDGKTRFWFDSLHSINADVFVNVLKPFGRLGVVAALALLLWVGGLVAKNAKLQRAGRSIVLSVMLSSLVVFVAKPIFGRMERQSATHIRKNTPTWASKVDARWGRFPSGDSTMAFATASTLAFEFPPAALLFYALGAMVGLGRVYVGAHLLSDTFAGVWLGWGAARWVFQRENRTLDTLRRAFLPPRKN